MKVHYRLASGTKRVMHELLCKHQVYSAGLQVKQQERKAARMATAATVSNATAQGTVIVTEKATASEAAQTSKKDISADAGVIITPLAE